jgi:hypothetical protein
MLKEMNSDPPHSNKHTITTLKKKRMLKKTSKLWTEMFYFVIYVRGKLDLMMMIQCDMHVKFPEQPTRQVICFMLHASKRYNAHFFLHEHWTNKEEVLGCWTENASCRLLDNDNSNSTSN